MNPLARLLARRIAATGPICLADYMADCLLHPEYGYYTSREPFGRQGDFITAPEISQMFGELVGLALAQSWLEQGSPAPFALVELGPGRGTLMADILRATRMVPGFHRALRLHLVEAAPRMRALQADALRGHEPTWHDSPATLPEMPLLLVANEFFDALPIRQFRRHERGWRELQVTLDADGALAFALSEPAPLALLDHRLKDTRPGDIVEHRPAAGPLIEALAGSIARHGGVALLFDYGGWRSLGDTLQALHRQAPDHPLAHPGQADLTAHVDFEALSQAAAPLLTVTPMITQGTFLHRLGIGARARKLAESLRGEALESHLAAFHRLTDPSEMGTLFKTIALHPKGAPPPPGHGG